jgi:hypothetical protein
MTTRKVARLAAAFVLILTSAGGLVAAAGPAQAKTPPTSNCTTEFNDDTASSLGISAYNYVVCTYSNGSWTRTNGPAYITRDGVLVSGSTTGSAPFLGNSGPGYANYECNGATENSYYLYGPGADQTLACG